jgi:hypothetical protein
VKTDDELKAELLQRAKAGLPRPRLDSDDEHERELAEALIRFTTPPRHIRQQFAADVANFSATAVVNHWNDNPDFAVIADMEIAEEDAALIEDFVNVGEDDTYRDVLEHLMQLEQDEDYYEDGTDDEEEDN